METRINFASVEEFFNAFKKCTFGLNVVTMTTPKLIGRNNPYKGCDIKKVTFIKNAICGASYQSILLQARKEEMKTREAIITEMIKNYGDSYGCGCIDNILNEFSKLQKQAVKEQKKMIETNFNEKLVWGEWLIYPLIIGLNDKKYLRVYHNTNKTETKSFYFDGDRMIPKESYEYQLLMDCLYKPNNVPQKQSENGFDKKIIPYAYSFENILYLGQGNKEYKKNDYLTCDKIKFVFETM